MSETAGAELELFAKADAYEGSTMIVFSDKGIAMRYGEHRHSTHGQVGLIAGCEDTRDGTGLFVMWRDRVPPEKLEERIANCRWLLEEVLAGRYARPVPGEANELWSGGFPDSKS